MVDRLLRLMADDTTTGREDAGLKTLLGILRAAGARVETTEVAPGRTNVLARFGGDPEALFTTHLDTVPPYLPPSVDRQKRIVRGRCACDAKGQIVAQLAAIEALVASGRSNVAWLGVVGEETDSIGAKFVENEAARAAPFPNLKVVFNGEPTRNVAGSGQRGIAHLRLRCRGKAAHSGSPEKGRSAALDMIDWIQELRRTPLKSHDELGAEVWNLGRLESGNAINVVPEAAEAHVLLRQVPGSTFVDAARNAAPQDATLDVLAETPPDVFPPIEGLKREPLPFGSDAPRLRKLAKSGAVVLIGPGDIGVAHSVDEHVRIDDLIEGAAILERSALRFLETAP
jgi:acetylornithine deacetylase